MRDPGPARSSPALLNSLAEHTASKLQRTEQSCRSSLPPPKAAIFSPSSFLPLTAQAEDSEIDLWRRKCLLKEPLVTGHLTLIGYRYISRSETNVPISFFSVSLPPFFLVDALQCLLSVTKRPRLPPCPLAFSSKT